jgi:hypothetical protein
MWPLADLLTTFDAQTLAPKKGLNRMAMDKIKKPSKKIEASGVSY